MEVLAVFGGDVLNDGVVEEVEVHVDGDGGAFAGGQAPRLPVVLLPGGGALAVEDPAVDNQVIDILENNPTVLRFEAVGVGGRQECGPYCLEAHRRSSAGAFEIHGPHHVFPCLDYDFALRRSIATFFPSFHDRLHTPN